MSPLPYVRPARPVDPPRFADPEFVRAADWLARGADAPAVTVIGAPFAAGSISGARCDLAPDAVRGALARFSVWNTDRAVSVEGLAASDAGDIEFDGDDVVAAQERIAAVVAAAQGVLVLLGGDNSVTVGGARGVSADALLTFDAHHDCRDPGVRVTNGSPVRQLVEGGLSAVAQIGISGFANAEAHARWALEHKIHSISAAKVRADGIGKTVRGALGFLGRAERIWVDFDMDVLDRGFAPGAPAAMPGGLSPVELNEAAFILGREPSVAGIDITELDPSADVADITVRAAASVLMHYLAGVASR